MATQNTIELNGNLYDALTGKPLGNVVLPPKTIDGFRKPTKTTAPLRPAPSTTDQQRTQKSQTLMRKAVKKPVSHAVHSKSHLANTPKEPKPIAPTRSARRGVHITPLKTISPTIAKLPVQAVPSIRPVSEVVMIPKAKPAATVQHDTNPTQSLLQNALANATSHEEPMVKKRTHLSKKHRFAYVACGLVIGFAIAGTVLYRKVPDLALKVAAKRAGVSASLPAYQPAGFSMRGPIEYQKGKLILNYASNSDSRSFNITQSTSEWNSESLLKQFVNPKGTNYQTLQDKGRTIFIYDGSNATWVSGGVWYKIEGNSALTSDQLLKIANSL